MVDIIPKQQETELSSIILTTAVVILVVAVGSFGLFTFLKAKTAGELSEATELLMQGKSKEEATLESSIISVKRKIEDFAALAQTRSNPSSFFEFVEENTHPNVIFSQLGLNPKEKKAVMSGYTKTFKNLEEQIVQLRGQSEIEEIELTTISLGEAGQVRFTLSLQFKSSFFKAQ